MPIERTDPCICIEDVLRRTSVLQGVATYHASTLSHEIIRTEAYGAKVTIARVPFDRCHLLSFRLLGGEAPQRQQSPITISEVVTFVLPILEVMVDLIFGILVHHPLHNLYGQLHALRVERVRFTLLLFLLLLKEWLAFLLVFLLLRGLYLALVLVKDFPLSHRFTEASRGRWLCGPTSVTQDWVLRLCCTLAEVELIAQRILHRPLCIIFGRIEILINCLQCLPLACFLLFLFTNLELVLKLLALFVEDLAINLHVEHALIHLIFSLEDLLLERELCDVLRSPWICRVEYPWWNLFL
mmetsp:Transcript_17419/g.31402  ORF Transcript_17419/g.31402 Transcript_17419/m.31402 type:complete len:298 (-) Transcript_17419:254-1147(-)